MVAADGLCDDDVRGGPAFFFFSSVVDRVARQ